MKQMTKYRLILTLVLSILLSSCVFGPQPFKEVMTDWAPHHETLGTNFVFQKVSQPKYVKETVVYQVDTEMELAFLAMILFDQGTTLFFIQDRDFSIKKTYAYLDALMIHAFKFSMGTKTYTQGDAVVKTLDYVKIELYNDHVSVINADIDAFIKAKVTATDATVKKLKDIHDGLILTTQYDTAVLDLDLTQILDHTPFEAYGLFENHKAVCSGYAKSFMGIARQLKIPVLTVSSTKMNHAWNLVYNGNAWLYVDVTFDDPVPDKAGRILDTYFLLDEHKITTESSTIKAHVFDQSTDSTLNAQDYMTFAQYVFPAN